MAMKNGPGRKSQYIAQKQAGMNYTWLGDELAARVNDAIIQELEPIFAAMEGEAKSLVGSDSGKLRSTIQSRVIKRKDGTGVTAVLEAGDRGITYAVMQEVGPNPSSKRQQKRLARGLKSKTWRFRPYIRPAFNKHIREAEAAVAQAVGKARP